MSRCGDCGHYEEEHPDCCDCGIFIDEYDLEAELELGEDG